MRLVIIESPYAGHSTLQAENDHEVWLNIEYARAALNHSINKGEAPLASHLLYTQPGVLRDTRPDERALGISLGLAWRWKAEAQIFYTDKGWSKGMLSALHMGLQEPRQIEIRAIWGKVRVPEEYVELIRARAIPLEEGAKI